MKKLKLVTILGTRPELIRLSVIINKCDQFFEHSLIHTGQNYDFELNEIFFKELKIRKPDHFLEVAANDLGETLGNVISKSYSLLSKLKPDALLVLGDTNSALSIISAKRLKIPIFHMEAGNRCFDQNVPEEINRKVADHLADINLTYTENSRRYLLAEGFRKDFVFTTGSPLKEVIQTYADSIDASDILNKFKIEKAKYIVTSIHREENLDIKDNFENIVKGINKVSNLYKLPVIFSTHPRTRLKIQSLNIKTDSIKFINPLGFFDYVKLQSKAFVTLSDSGTISEESAIMGFPAVSVRTSTERPEAIDYGSIVLGNIDEDSMVQSVEIALKTFSKDHLEIPNEYHAGNVSTRIVKIIQGYTSVVNREIWKK
ncbi:UDP-N-acetylglucosamine 2-epimerase (non-hydrolyzing) [Flavobacteriaceae bacterium]|nr:UDP-N-acetylglucosamine 2-epimerase (non-hydrolyzing) [Flavobacteriaceae bacterium]